MSFQEVPGLVIVEALIKKKRKQPLDEQHFQSSTYYVLHLSPGLFLVKHFQFVSIYK